MEKHDIIVVGASAGGIEALTELFRRLKPNLRAALFIVVHLSPITKSYLPSILSRLGGIPAIHAEDGQEIRYGQAIVAPPNQHLELEDGQIRLTVGPKENGFRPAVDPLFESAARVYGSRVVGIILSGNLYDGTIGLQAIKRAGGLAIVQDPAQAIYPGMPTSALEYVQVDHVLSVPEIADLLNMFQDRTNGKRGGEPVVESRQHPGDLGSEIIATEFEGYEKGIGQNQRSVLTCPDCGGVLWEIQDDKVIHYRCHVGHDYSPEVLLADQDGRVENAYWAAIRMLVEKAALAKRLAIRARKSGFTELENVYVEQARQADKDADLLRETWFHRMLHVPKTDTAGEKANKDIAGAEQQD